MSTSVDALARRIISLERQVARMGGPRLAYSALEDGAIDEYETVAGPGGELAPQLVSVIGRQHDGTHGIVTVAGPPPPTPSAGTTEPVAGGLRYRWDGTWDPAMLAGPNADFAPTPIVAPEDFLRAEVHASTDPQMSALLFLTLRRTIESPRGGEVEFGVPQDTDFYVRLVIRTKAGKRSFGKTIGPFRAGKVAEGDIDMDFSVFGGTTVHYGPTAPDRAAVTVNVGDLWHEEVSAGPPPVYRIHRWMPTGEWVLLADQGAADALTAAILAQQAADAKAQVFHETEAPTGLPADAKAIWFDTDDGNRQRVWNGSTGLWDDRLLGTGAFQPQSIIASDVLATGTVSATLLESVLVLAGTVVAGDPNGPHAEMRPEGFFGFAFNPDGGLQQAAGLGTNGLDGLTFSDPLTGQTTVAFTPDGAGALQTLSVAGIDTDGDGATDSGFTVYGREFTEHIEDRTLGVRGSAFTADAANGVLASGITTRIGLGEVSLVSDSTRAYLLVFDGLHFAATAGPTRLLVSVRFTSDGSTPTISNGTIVGSKIGYLPTANEAYSVPAIIAQGGFSSVDGALIRLLVTVERLSGTGTISALTYSAPDAYRAPFRFFVADLGRDILDTYIPNNGGGTTAPPKKTYTSTWSANLIGAYLGNGSRRTDTTDLMQGYTDYYPAGGIQRSIAGFTAGAVAGEVGKTVTAALTGATVTKVEIGLKCNHSHAVAGGLARIGYHGETAVPATVPAASWEAFSGAFFKRGETRWMTLPAATFASWQSGAYRGLTVGPGGDYMRFDGSAGAKPGLRITYTR